MNKPFIKQALALLIGVGSLGVITVSAQTQTSLAPAGAHNKSHQARVPQPASLQPTEQMAWREIQERIDRMSHGEEAKDINASMHFMADDYTLYTLADKNSPQKVINRQQIAVYKKQNLDSLYSTSPETHTDIESISLKGNLATVVIFQNYVRVIRGGDGSPHEARTSVRHRETWIYSERGWLQKIVQELERGPIFLDGKVYNP